MKNFKKYFLLIPVFTLLFASNVSAGILSDKVTNKMQEQTAQTVSSAGYEDVEIYDIIANIISIALSILSIIFVILIIISGYNWMMAGGDEKVIETATARIKNAVIGLIIVLAAYAITTFVFNNLDSATGGGSGGNAEQTGNVNSTGNKTCNPACTGPTTCQDGQCK